MKKLSSITNIFLLPFISIKSKQFWGALSRTGWAFFQCERCLCSQSAILDIFCSSFGQYLSATLIVKVLALWTSVCVNIYVTNATAFFINYFMFLCSYIISFSVSMLRTSHISSLPVNVLYILTEAIDDGVSVLLY